MERVKSFLRRDRHAHGSQPVRSKQSPPPPVPAVLSVGFPNQQDLFRYRKQRGVNLGSWFVLERWIADAPFQGAAPPGQSDHDVARGPDGQRILEEHWDNWMAEDDWKWIAERGINTVRIPIGYYELCSVDPSVIVGTDFADLGHVFQGAWPRITTAIETAYRFGFGVLIDLHAAPGKQNADAHSGTSSNEISFFNSANLVHTTLILTSLLTQLDKYARNHTFPLPNIVGIELVNEPNPPNNDHAALQQWYKTTIEAMRRIDPDMPLYIGDSWRTDEYAGFIKSLGDQSSASTSSFLALDHHLYRCFTASDNSTPAAQHAAALRNPADGTPSTFARVSSTLASVGADLIVGEWSGALNPGSLQGVPDEHAAKREFVDAQLALYEKECGGWFWWTYKKQWGGDSGWTMRDAVEKGVFPGWVGVRAQRVTEHDHGQHERRDSALDKALGEHTAYWDQYPGNYEHGRFGEGFVRGWEDAYVFLCSAPTSRGSVSEIGFKGAWVKRRSAAHARSRGSGNVWEYEHGMTQGIAAAKADFQKTYC